MHLAGVDSIRLFDCRIIYGTDALIHLEPYVERHFDHGDRCFLLTDSNTHEFCRPVLDSFFHRVDAELIMDPGEKSKSLENVQRIWQWLMMENAGRNDCLVILGGGVLTDLGGYAASTYKRGMRYINIPTTLIGQADAAVGGKTALNYQGVKNMLGTIYQPVAVFADPIFLLTLEKEQLRNGFAEIVKCSLLTGEKAWQSVSKKGWDNHGDWLPLIAMAIRLKASLVKKDPADLGARRALNFGHTLGHAFESLSSLKYQPGLLHGQAVALGMIGEIYLSWRKVGLCWDKTVEIARYLRNNFPENPFSVDDGKVILEFIRQDKKNRAEETMFSLLDDFGKPALDRSCEPLVIQKAVEFVMKEKH